MKGDTPRELASFIAAWFRGRCIDFPILGISQRRRSQDVEIAASRYREIHGDRIAFLDVGHRATGADFERADSIFITRLSAIGQGPSLNFEFGDLEVNLLVHLAWRRVHNDLPRRETNLCRADANFSGAGGGDRARVGDGDVAHP